MEFPSWPSSAYAALCSASLGYREPSGTCSMMAYDNAPFHVQSMPRSLENNAVWGSRGPTEYLIIRQASAGYTKSTEIEMQDGRREFGMDVPRHGGSGKIMAGLRGFVSFRLQLNGGAPKARSVASVGRQKARGQRRAWPIRGALSAQAGRQATEGEPGIHAPISDHHTWPTVAAPHLQLQRRWLHVHSTGLVTIC